MTYIFRIIASCCLMIIWTLPAAAQIGVGGGLVYGSEVSALGISVKGKVVVSEMLAVSPGYTFFFIEGDGKLSTINGDAHYLMNLGDNIAFYPFVGLNIGSTNLTTKVGLNLGAGLEVMVQDNIAVYGEAKYVLSDFDQLVIALGALLYIGDR